MKRRYLIAGLLACILCWAIASLLHVHHGMSVYIVVPFALGTGAFGGITTPGE